MSIRYHIIKQLKEQPETVAAGSKWPPEEEEQLIHSLANGKDIDEIAKEHKRTVGGIRSRMRNIAVSMIENDGKSIEEVCVVLHMTTQDVEDAQKRRNVACNKSSTSKSKVEPRVETELDVLKDIRKLLIQIEANLIKDSL